MNFSPDGRHTIPEVIVLKQKRNKKSKRFTSNPSEVIEQVNAASATDMTGLIPAAPADGQAYEGYEDIYPEGLPEE